MRRSCCLLLSTLACLSLAPTARATTISFDLVVVGDESGSVGSNFNIQTAFISDLVNSLTFGSDAVAAGLVAAGSSSRVITPGITSSRPVFLNALFNWSSLQSGASCPACGLSQAEALLASSRVGVPDVVLLISDGQTTGDVSAAAASLKATGATLIVIEVGGGSGLPGGLASSPNESYLLSSFNELGGIQAGVLANLEAVPEPGTGLLVGAGLLCLAVR